MFSAISENIHHFSVGCQIGPSVKVKPAFTWRNAAHAAKTPPVRAGVVACFSASASVRVSFCVQKRGDAAMSIGRTYQPPL
jgi:hypothetical protein